MHPRRGAGLEPAQREAVVHKAAGQRCGGVGAVGATVVVGFPHKDAPAQRGAGGNDHRLAAVVPAQLGVHAPHRAALNVQPGDLRLMDGKVRRGFQRVLHPDVVALAVGLHPQAVHRGAFAPVEHPALQKGGVGGKAHQPAQRVHLPHQMPLGGAADGGVAGHVADEVQRQREHGGAGPQHRRRVGGLDAGVARADDDDVIVCEMVKMWLHVYQNPFFIFQRRTSQIPRQWCFRRRFRR